MQMSLGQSHRLPTIMLSDPSVTMGLLTSFTSAVIIISLSFTGLVYTVAKAKAVLCVGLDFAGQDVFCLL